MAGYKLDVPVDLSERTTHKLELTKNIIHLISGATTLLTICIVAPLIATEAKYLVRKEIRNHENIIFTNFLFI